MLFTRARLRRLLQPHVAACFALFCLMLVGLFIFPHGLADNGDFYRIIHNLGLSHTGPDSVSYFSYFTPQYRETPYYIDYRVSFLSSQSLFIELSILLNNIFLHNGLYDIRFLAAIYAAGFLAATYIILKFMTSAVRLAIDETSPRVAKVLPWAFAGLYVFIFGDFGYLLYFNSFFGEPLSYVSLLLLTALTLRLATSARPGIPLYIAWLLTAAVFIGAKQQNAPVGVLLIAFIFCLLKLRRDSRWKRAVLFSVAGIAVVSAVVFLAVSGDIQYLNQNHLLAMGLDRYVDTEQELTDLNISPQFYILKDQTGYEDYPVVLITSPLMFSGAYNQLSTLDAALFYMHSPGPLLKQLESASDKAFTIRANLGNFPQSAGKPSGAQTHFFAGYGFLKQRMFPRTFGFLAVAFAAAAIAAAWIYRQFYRRGDMAARLAVEYGVFVGLMGVLQVFISVLGSGDADLQKHLFLFNADFDLLLFALVCCLVCRVWQTGKNRIRAKPAVPA